jgi:hypothetical protein
MVQYPGACPKRGERTFSVCQANPMVMRVRNPWLSCGWALSLTAPACLRRGKQAPTPLNRGMEVSQEAVEAAVWALEASRPLAEAFARSRWRALDAFNAGGGLSLMLEIVQAAPGERCTALLYPPPPPKKKKKKKKKGKGHTLFHVDVSPLRAIIEMRILLLAVK